MTNRGETDPPEPPPEPEVEYGMPDDAEEARRPSVVERLSDMLGKRPHLRSLALTGLFLIAVFGVLYVARAVFIPLAFALMLYFLLRPTVRILGRLLIPRAIGSALVLGGLLALFGLAVVELGAPATQWAERLPAALRQLEKKSEVLRKPVARVSELAERVERVTTVNRDDKSRQVAIERPPLFDVIIERAAGLVTELFVMLIAAYFLLIDGDALLGRLFRWLPDVSERERAGAVINEVERRMSQYLRTVTLINVMLGVALGALLSAVHMPNPWLWAVMATVLNYVPYLGAAIGIVTVALASVVTFPSLSDALLPPLTYLGLATIEGNVLSPLILGRAFEISPLVVFVWLVFWGWLWSVPGAIVAVPLLMLLKITCEQSPTLRPIADLMRR
jgi:predicted PurR-regulated permease PerM